MIYNTHLKELLTGNSHTVLYAVLYKYVFKCNLKTASEGACLMYKGKLFQSFGAATAKARSPLLFNLALGETKSSCPADLSALDGAYGCNRSERYLGAVLFNDLKTKSKILKSILKRTGNQ